MKIGIMGGTFNPIHNGHLIMSEQIREQIGLDKIIFVPCYLPPHKSGENVISGSHRINMAKIATQDNDFFDVSDIEIQEGKVSYSIDLVKKIKSIYPQDDIYFLIGEDSLLDLHTWRDIKQLLDLCTFVTAKRTQNIDLAKEFQDNNTLFDKKNMEKLCQNIVQTNVITLSSSEIREKTMNNCSLKYIIPEKVNTYIKENNLYR